MLINPFLEYLEFEKKYSKHTVKAYTNDLTNFRDYINIQYGSYCDNEINYAMIRMWMVTLVNSGVSNKTINRKITSLNSYFKFLIKTDTLLINPLQKHKALKVEKKVQIPFSEQEVDDVITKLSSDDSFEGLRDKLIVELFYATGIRRVELIELKMQDVDLVSKTIKVKGKRNKERFLPLIESIINSIKNYLNSRAILNSIADVNYVFLTKKGDKIYETLVYRVINSYFSEVSTKTKTSPHVLRHTFASHLLNNGADLNGIKELLGHTSLAATQIYTHNSIAKLKQTYLSAHPRNKKIK